MDNLIEHRKYEENHGKLLGKKFYKTLKSKNREAIETKLATYVLPGTFLKLNKLSHTYLSYIIKSLNTTILDLITEYEKAQNIITHYRKEITKESLNDFIDDLLTPSQGEIGCSDFEYQVRKEYHKKDNTFCNHIYCRYWFDNEEWGNCVRFTIAQAADDGGWTLEKIGGIKNALGRGELTRERARQIEVEAVKMFVENLKKEEGLMPLIEHFVKIAKEDEYGLRVKVGLGITEGKSNLHRRSGQENTRVA